MKNHVKIVTDNFKKQIELNLKITNTGFTQTILHQKKKKKQFGMFNVLII